MKKKLVISTLLASLLMSTSTLMASSLHDSVAQIEQKALQNPAVVQGHKKAESAVMQAQEREAYLAKVERGAFKQEVTQEESRRLQSIVTKAVTAHKHALSKAPKAFMTALNDTIGALNALHANKTKEAQKLLEKASKEFDAAIKANPKLALIPVADNVDVKIFTGDAALVAHIKASAEELLTLNDTQTAIDMLLPLQDEIEIRTQLIPVILYPKATKEAAKALKAGKKDKAFEILMTALNATQVSIIEIPIPLLTAQDMVREASKLEKSHKKKALKLLNAAQDELQKAVLLGYTNRYAPSYENLNKQIEALKSEIKGKNIVAKLYEKLLNSFKDLTKKESKEAKNAHK